MILLEIGLKGFFFTQCVCVYMHEGMGKCVSFYHVDSRNQTELVGLGHKYLSPEPTYKNMFIMKVRRLRL